MKTKMTNIEDYLVYDKGVHRFSLDAKEIVKLIPDVTCFGDEKTIQNVLDEHSQLLYEWIKSQTPRENHDVIIFILAKEESLRQTIYDALTEMLRADIYSNFSQARHELGINFKNGQIINSEIIRDKVIPEEVKKIIENAPINLLYAGCFLKYQELPHDKYERWDY